MYVTTASNKTDPRGMYQRIEREFGQTLLWWVWVCCERITQVDKENITKHLETKPVKKMEMKRLLGDKNIVLEGKELTHFVTNKRKMFFEFIWDPRCDRILQ